MKFLGGGGDASGHGVDALGAGGGEEEAGSGGYAGAEGEGVAGEDAGGDMDGLDDEGVAVPVGAAEVEGGVDFAVGEVGSTVGIDPAGDMEVTLHGGWVKG